MLVVSALSFAAAQGATTTATTTPVLPPPVTTGDARIDVQIRTLNKEMEAKIRAIREEYQKKLKALIGERKILRASSTEARKELKKERKEDREEEREEVRGTSTMKIGLNRGATTTKASPNGNAWGFFLRFFGAAKPANTQ